MGLFLPRGNDLPLSDHWENALKTSNNTLKKRPSQRQISLSEALGPVATIVLPLKLSPIFELPMSLPCPFSTAAPAEPRGEKKLFLVQILGGENF